MCMCVDYQTNLQYVCYHAVLSDCQCLLVFITGIYIAGSELYCFLIITVSCSLINLQYSNAFHLLPNLEANHFQPPSS